MRAGTITNTIQEVGGREMIPEKNLRSDSKVRRQSGTWMKGSNQALTGYRSAVMTHSRDGELRLRADHFQQKYLMKIPSLMASHSEFHEPLSIHWIVAGFKGDFSLGQRPVLRVLR
jgi:hypothetical protein